MENFVVRPGVFCGVLAYLVTPNHIGTKFNQRNSIFRSSIWDATTGQLLSASFKKFVNWSENPENFPVPTTLKGCSIVDKIDGSACIIDYSNSQLSMRTRGTFSVDSADNASDFVHCLSKYPKLSEWLETHPNYSILTEITTPNLRIVLHYGDEPDFWLTGAINKDDYSLMSQTDLDTLALELEMKRPGRYKFDDISTMLNEVDMWNGKEGVCLYSPNGQQIWKIKASSYLVKHRLKEEFSNFEKVLDFYIQEKCPAYNDFYARVESVVDFETANEIRGDISKCVDASKGVNDIVNGMKKFVDGTLRPMGDPTDKKSRGQMARHVLSAYGDTNRASFIFKILDGKDLETDDIKKLYYQVLKK